MVRALGMPTKTTPSKEGTSEAGVLGRRGHRPPQHFLCIPGLTSCMPCVGLHASYLHVCGPWGTGGAARQAPSVSTSLGLLFGSLPPEFATSETRG